jgi:tRNA pseudouridine13 synthase
VSPQRIAFHLCCLERHPTSSSAVGVATADLFFISEDAKGTLSLMPEFRVRERALLESLHRFGVTEEGCVRAWFSFPHSMRIFYIHAYSSRIWNEAASYRLAAYGPKVVEGDLICSDEDADKHFPSSKVSTRHLR